MARRLEKAKKVRINITIVSASALCLTHRGTITMNVRARDSTRPTCPTFKAKRG